METRNLELKTEAEAVREKLEGKTFIAIRQAGDTGQLYGSVSTRDIAEVMTEEGFTVGRQQVLLDRPIKNLGLHDVRIALHPKLKRTSTSTSRAAWMKLNVKPVAKICLSSPGEDETESGGEEVLSAEEVFEDEALAKEIEEGWKTWLRRTPKNPIQTKTPNPLKNRNLRQMARTTRRLKLGGCKFLGLCKHAADRGSIKAFRGVAPNKGYSCLVSRPTPI